MKSLDAFGHPIRLNFEQKGSTHQTLCGALFTVVFIIVALAILFGFSVIHFNKNTIDVSQGLVSKQVISTVPTDEIQPTWLVFFATDQNRNKVKIDPKFLELTLNGIKLDTCSNDRVRTHASLMRSGEVFYCTSIQQMAFTREFQFLVRQKCMDCEDALRQFNFHLATLDYVFNGVLVENNYEEPKAASRPANATANASNGTNATKNATNATIPTNVTKNATNATTVSQPVTVKNGDGDNDEDD